MKTTLLRIFLHAILLVGTFWEIFKVRQIRDLIPGVHLPIPNMDFKEFLFFLGLAVLAWVIVGIYTGFYSLTDNIKNSVSKFFKSWILWLVLLSFLVFFGQGFLFKNGISRLVLLWWWLFSGLAISLADKFLLRVRQKLGFKDKILIINFSEKLLKSVKNALEGYEKIEIIDGKDFFEKESSLNVDPSLKVLILWDPDLEKLQSIIDILRNKWVKIYHLSNHSLVEDIVFTPSTLGPLVVTQYKPSPLDGRWVVVKRIFDVIASLLFLILFGWLYMLISLYILIKDGRPILYVSQRVWKNGQLFPMFKFRTMVKNADQLKAKLQNLNQRKGPLFKIKNDPRIIPWMHWIRKFSLDELPQVFNILRWEMSWVGPRPHLPQEVQKYKSWQKRLLSFPPGLTGYAQVFWRDSLSFDEEARLDLWYIQNWSLWLDIYVILATFRVLAQGK